MLTLITLSAFAICVYFIITIMIAAMSHDAILDKAAAKAKAIASAPTRQGSRGATPRHYRAFSLLAARVRGLEESSALHAFRTRAKAIKLEDDGDVRAEALRVMDSFATVVDEYAPLHDVSDPGERCTRQAALMTTVAQLDEALDAILARSSQSPDGFVTATRFVELRYADPLGDRLLGKTREA